MPTNPSRFPNLLIVGAPRCGTTSLHDWLIAHPRIGGAARKETFYLMDRGSFDFEPRCNVHDHGLDGYAALFERCAGAEVRVESTTGYLYQQTALRVLPELPGEPKFVVVLREPAARVLSAFRYYRGHKAQLPRDLTFRGFVEAIDAQDPVVAANEFLHGAIEHSRYATYLARWRERLGPERLRVVLFERMRADPAATVPALASWCGVDPGFYAGYGWPSRNESYEVRFPLLHAAVRRWALPLVRSEKIRRGLRRGYVRAVGGKTRRDDDEAVALAELRGRFVEDNARLARDWGLDLSCWSPER